MLKKGPAVEALLHGHLRQEKALSISLSYQKSVHAYLHLRRFPDAAKR